MAANKGFFSTQPPAPPAQVKGLTFTSVGSSQAMPCSGYSYGEVQRFFVTNPCQALTRSLFEVTNDSGRRMLVAVSWTQMPDPTRAGELKRLADRSGTGNVAELSREVPRYSSTKFTGNAYDSHIDGSTTVIAQAEPLAGNPDSALLRRTARAGLQAPRPTD
ncbi:hypothetical protein GCM10012275_59060 [Longimycelium tulufanense]|uniref:Uncharacterized protein n=1 Tax=Longimycelium tulufanense TaxID=907463 RepID=A0A8J3FZ16_9PSEU|nr:hypothetical protein [Longimycelium tulufanense]GGM80600.1 hypothetical protein GCM10012275_59060 [Longimycelium tulufanense]